MSNITEIIKTLGFAYPQQNIPAETWKLYAEFFATEDQNMLKRAVTNWVGRESWFPKLPELRAELDAVLYADGFDTRPWWTKAGMTTDQVDAMIWEAETERDPNFGQLHAQRDEPRTQPPPMR